MEQNAKNDGGPAFPVLYGQTNGLDGMSLRDWFAGQALAGILAANSPNTWESDAANAYFAADAMLAERSKDAAQPILSEPQGVENRDRHT